MENENVEKKSKNLFKSKKFYLCLVSVLLVVAIVSVTLVLVLNKKCKTHKWGEWAETTPATCTEKGVDTRECGKCHEKETRETDALGHDWQEPTYAWSEDFKTCTATVVCSRDASHVETETVNSVFVGIAPNCKDDGQGHYEATFTNTRFVKQETEDRAYLALDHKWSEPTYTWSEDYSRCTAIVVCQNDNNHTITETVDSTYLDTREPSCGETGLRTYSATFVEYYALFGTKTEEVVVPALIHDWAAATYEWAEDNSTCTATIVCARDVSHVVTETVNVTSDYTDIPTCTESGVREYRAEFTNPLFETRVKTEVVDALGHNLVLDEEHSTPATCQTKGNNHYYCSKCDYTEDEETLGEHTWVGTQDCTHSRECSVCHTVEPPLGHDHQEDLDRYVPAGCETDGKRVYVCDRCGDEYEVVIEATGHNLDFENSRFDVVEGKDCTYVYSYKCLNCGEYVPYGSEIVKHTYIAQVTTPSTCQTPGEKTYYCTVCTHSYTEEYPVDPTAHNWVDDGDGVHFHCANEGCTETKVVFDKSTAIETTLPVTDVTGKSEVVLENATITLDETTLSNATGSVTLKADKLTGDDRNDILNSLDDESVVAQIGDNPIYNFDLTDENGKVDFSESSVTVTIEYELKNNEDVDSIYVWYVSAEGVETIKATYNEVNGKGYVSFTVTHFSYYTILNLTNEQVCAEEDHNWIVAEIVDATCVHEGHTVEVCERCGATRTTNSEAALTHSYVKDEENSKAATCTENGVLIEVCSECGHTHTEVLPATGHHFEVSDSEAATCTENGYKHYKCTNEGCNAEYYEVLISTGHAWGEVSYEWSDDKTTCVATRVCANDNAHVETEVATVEVNVTDPTCEDDGVTVYTARFLNRAFETQVVTYTVDALGHAWGEATYEWAEDNLTCIAKRVCLNDETHEKIENVAVSSKRTEATCIEDGEVIYTAYFDGEGFETQTKVVVLEALGHAWGEATYEWEDNNTICVASCVCGNNPNHHLIEEVETVFEGTEATCTENGQGVYTATFENEQFETQTKTLIYPAHHVGDFVCKVCGEEFVTTEWFESTWNYFKGKTFTLQLTNFNLSTDDEKLDIQFGELYLSLDENNNIYGFATGRYSLTDYYYGYSNEPIKLEYEFNAVVKDNMLYIKYVGDERNSIWDGFDEEVYNNKYEQYSNTRYLMISLEDLGGFLLTEFLPEAEGYLPEGFTAEMLLAMVQEYAEAYLTDENIALVKAWYEESLAPYIQNIIDKNKTDFFKFVRLFANDLFEVETTKEGLVLKFSPDALLRLNEEAFTLSLREFIELRIGEGKINEIETALISAFVTGKTVGDALDILAERGIDIDAFIDVLDALAGKFGTSLDEIAQMVMAMVMSEEGNGNPDPDQAMSMEEAEQGQEFGIKAMLAYYKQTELRDIVMMILSEQEMEEQEKQAMMSMVQSILYPEIDAEAEDYEEQMTDYVASLKMMLDLELNTYLDEMTIYDLVASMFYVKPVIMKDTGNAEVLDSQQDPVSNFDTFKAMMKTEIDGILTEVKQFSDIRLFFDKNGGFQKLVVRVGGEEIAEDFNLEFTLQLFEGEVTKFDYDALIEEVNGVCNPLIITEENSGEWFENSTEYTLEYDEENNPTEIYFERETPSDELTSDKYRFYDYYGEINLDYESEWGYVERYITHQSITYQLGTTFMYATKGCDGYYFVTYVCPVVREYTVIVVDNAIFYSGKEGVTLDDAIVATVNVTRNEIGNITYIFKDGKLFNIDINLYEDDLEKLHNYTIESEEKTEGCAHADHEHYVCSDCGREKDVTFIKIHNTDKLVYGGDEYDMYLYVCDCGDSVYFNYNYWSDTIKQNGYYSELKHCWVEEYTSLDLKIVKEEGNNDIYKVYKYINGKETFIATYVDLY